MRGKSLAKSLAFVEPGPSHHQEMMTATQIGVRTWRLQVSQMSSDTTLNGWTRRRIVCYGCGGKLRPSDSSVPPPPFDVVVSTKEYRSWYDKSTGTTKITKKPEATHYHLNPVCLGAKNVHF
ncbi:unnamed protein product, partial [Porites lobata]